jgi:hypothetical protein
MQFVKETTCIEDDTVVGKIVDSSDGLQFLATDRILLDADQLIEIAQQMGKNVIRTSREIIEISEEGEDS